MLSVVDAINGNGPPGAAPAAPPTSATPTPAHEGYLVKESTGMLSRRLLPGLITLVALFALLAWHGPAHGNAAPAGDGRHTAPTVAVAAPGDFAGLVDIGGGRRLYLECRGQGSPTVVLEDGAGLGADQWSVDFAEGAGTRTMVLPDVAGFSRVCAYDRPGIVLAINPASSPPTPADQLFPSRSDPAPMPRSAGDVVADLHALLQAAGVPGPYVLAGHSFGGLVVQLYARAYPDEVAGLVLIDAAHEEFYPAWQALLGPAAWAQLMMATQQPPAGLEGYTDFERLDLDTSVAQGRNARANQPLRLMPLSVLTHGLPFAALVPEWPGEAFERLWLSKQHDLVASAPQSRFTIAATSGHLIQQDQPELVTEAIRQVVAGVRQADTWYDLSSCCAK